MRNHFMTYRHLLWIIPLIFFIFFNTAVLVSAQEGVLPLPGEYERVFTPGEVLSASPADIASRFGHAVAVDGDWMVVGASSYGTSGAAFVFYRSAAGIWSQYTLLTGSDTADEDNFGFAVAIEDNTIMVGAHHQGAEDKGAVYVFVNNAGIWTQQARLQPTLNNFAYFGRQIALDGNRAVIAASGIGGAFVYQRDTFGHWNLEIKLPTTVFDTFAVDIDGTRVAVSSLTEDMFAGAVYLYELVGGTWTETAQLRASDASGFHYFGFSLVLDDESLFVSRHPQEPITVTSSAARAVTSGAVYVFQYSAGVWTEQQILTASDGSSYDSFGIALAIQDDVLVIGRYADDSAYRFDRNGTGWLQTGKIAAVADSFGFSLDLDQGTLVGGAPLASGEGRVHVYNDPALAPVELLVDGGFEANAVGWVVKNPTGDKVKCNKTGKIFAYEGVCAWRFKGVAGENAKIQQIITTGVEADDTLTLSGYVSSTSPADSTVKVVVKYLDTTLPKGKITVNVLSQTSDYISFTTLQPALTVNVTAPVDKIKVMVKNKGQSGKVYYDALSLTVQ